MSAKRKRSLVERARFLGGATITGGQARNGTISKGTYNNRTKGTTNQRKTSGRGSVSEIRRRNELLESHQAPSIPIPNRRHPTISTLCLSLYPVAHILKLPHLPSF